MPHQPVLQIGQTRVKIFGTFHISGKAISRLISGNLDQSQVVQFIVSRRTKSGSAQRCRYGRAGYLPEKIACSMGLY